MSEEKRKDFDQITIKSPIVLFCDDFMGDYKVYGHIELRGKKRKFINSFTKEIDNENWSQRSFWSYK